MLLTKGRVQTVVEVVVVQQQREEEAEELIQWTGCGKVLSPWGWPFMSMVLPG